ncbi:HotDog domain-containing protein [Halteromyces radiatus]|uniref:HotDog domain-containing protein n=1 Tax=Halteromyces radiatus TaxID=101107 RepID=UPI00221ED099|nr:HotDog domain-containing protein [Halteromyces radiatus]KAI8099571.1 HotDog domain-containing protein [Halteromyces radiatus]
MKADASLAKTYPQVYEMVEFHNKGKAPHWTDYVSKDLVLAEVTPGQVVWEMEVKESHCNQLGNLHGGCVATLIDICTSFVTLAHEGKSKWRSMGVSTDLSVSYFLGIPAGETIRIVCTANRIGKNLASIRSMIYNSNGQICYSGSHTKFNIDSRL